MTPQARRALEYVGNASGNATGDQFFEDHAPIGPELWRELRYPVTLIQHDPAEGRSRYVVLTDAGRAALASLILAGRAVNEPDIEVVERP